jgi:ABC-type transporter Mla MlaB component
VVGTALFKGELLGDNDAGFDAVRLALKKNAHLRLDLSKLRKLDAGGCERLLALLQQARRKNRAEIDLLGRDSLGACSTTTSLPVARKTGRAGC